MGFDSDSGARKAGGRRVPVSVLVVVAFLVTCGGIALLLAYADARKQAWYAGFAMIDWELPALQGQRWDDAPHIIRLYEDVLVPCSWASEEHIVLGGAAIASLAYVETGEYDKAASALEKAGHRARPYVWGNLMMDRISQRGQWSELRAWGLKSPGETGLLLEAWADLEEGGSTPALISRLESIAAANRDLRQCDAFWLVARAHLMAGDTARAKEWVSRYLEAAGYLAEGRDDTRVHDSYRRSVLGRAYARSAFILAELDPAGAQSAAEEALKWLEDIDSWYVGLCPAGVRVDHSELVQCWVGDKRELAKLEKDVKSLQARLAAGMATGAVLRSP